MSDRPIAYEMPVGTIVATTDGVWICERPYDFAGRGGWCGFWQGRARVDVQAGWIEGLFSDGLATVMRIGRGYPGTPA